MFSFLKRKQKNTTRGQENIPQNKTIGFLSANIQNAQRKASDYLALWVSKLSYRQKQLFLTLFFAGMVCLSLYPLYPAFVQNNHQKPAYLKFRNIKEPLSTALPDSLDIQYLKILKAHYDFEQKLKDSLDSHKH